MVIFSLGGLTLQRHLRAGAVRCSTAFVSLGGEREVVLDPFPEKGGRAVVGEDGRARLWRDGVEVPEPGSATGPGRSRLRWTDHQLATFAAKTLWAWLVLPRLVEGQGEGPHRIGSDRLWVAADGRVTRHEELERGWVHELRDHCQFGDVTVATRRRTVDRHGIPVLWADVVAGHVIPAKSLN